MPLILNLIQLISAFIRQICRQTCVYFLDSSPANNFKLEFAFSGLERKSMSKSLY